MGVCGVVWVFVLSCFFVVLIGREISFCDFDMIGVGMINVDF